MSRPLFQEGDSLQHGPEHHAEREDVRLGGVAQAAPHLRSHVEVRAAGGGEVLPTRAFTHLTQTKICHLKSRKEID